MNINEADKAHQKFLPKVKCEKSGETRQKVVKNILVKIDAIIDWFEEKTSLQFYGSSLLIIYNSETCQADVKMIDFAHVFMRLASRMKIIYLVFGI